MTYRKKNISNELLWEFLLDLNKFVKIHLYDIEHLTIIFRNDQFSIFLNETPPFLKDDSIIVISAIQGKNFTEKSTLFQLDYSYSLRLIRNEWLDSENLDFLLLYLPICFYACKALHLKRTVTLLHFAQSLDGRIAINNGHSKWIGSYENNVHAHRLRALCDAIIIGSNTLNIDKPRLNVRLVKGPDPLKIVVGNMPCKFDSLLENNGKVLFITSNEIINSKEIETVLIPKITNCINPFTILSELFSRGIHSLFIEGGAFTASSFLSAKSVDFLQLFISPKILGSGISSFKLHDITSIDDSINFSTHTYKQMSDGILFSGDVKY